MKLSIFFHFSLIIFMLCESSFSEKCNDRDNGSADTELATALKKLTKIAEENEMNLTVITSRVNYWADGSVKDVREYSAMRSNTVQPTVSKITNETVKDWFDTVRALPGAAKASGRSRIAHIEQGETGSIHRSSTDQDNVTQLIETKLYQIVTSVRYGRLGFTNDNPSYQRYFNIYVPASDGTKERVEIVTSHIKAKIPKHSKSITEEELKEIKEKMSDVIMTVEDGKLMGRLLKDHMTKKFKDEQWQVIVDPGYDFYIPAKKYALVIAGNSAALVYTM